MADSTSNNNGKLIIALYKTLYWFGGNALFGIFTLILMYFTKKVGGQNEQIANETEDLLRSGLVIFFFCSLMGSITIDLLISQELDLLTTQHKLLIKFVLIQMPFIILISLIAIYLCIVFGKLPKDYLMLSSKYTLFIIAFSVVYCFVYKMYSFAK